MASPQPARARRSSGRVAAIALVVGGYLLVVEPMLARARAAETTVPAREATLERRRLLVAPAPAPRRGAGRRRRAPRDRSRPAPAAGPDRAARRLRAPEARQGSAAPRGSVEVRSERVLPASDHRAAGGRHRADHHGQHPRHRRPPCPAWSDADRLLALKDVKIRVVAVGQPRELLTTLTVAGYLLPGAAGQPESRRPPLGATSTVSRRLLASTFCSVSSAASAPPG